MSGREEVLARIRSALADDGETAHPASTGPGKMDRGKKSKR